MMEMPEYNIAVRQDAQEEKTKGGLLLTPETLEREKHRACRGVVVGMGPGAYEEWPQVKPKIGDRVAFGQHAGTFVTDEDDGVEYRVMKDKDIIAIWRRAK